MKLSIIVPVYNEAATVDKVISKLKRLILPGCIKEIIVVDDGSTDATFKKIAKVSGIKRVRLAVNRGKGAAISAGLKQAAGDYVLIQDADLEYDPADIVDLIRPVKEKKATVVYGTRFIGPHKNMLFWHQTGNQLLSLVTNVLFNTTLSDMEVGYKLIPLPLLKSLNLKSKRFGFEPEVTAKILKRGIRIFEVPISYAGREFSEGKKITWIDGVEALILLIRYRLFN